MAHTAVHREKERILRWLQQNAAQKPSDPPLTADEQKKLDDLKADTPPDTELRADRSAPSDVPKIVSRPIIMRDVELLLNDIVKSLMSEGVIFGDIDKNGYAKGFQAEQASDVVALLFLGGGLPEEFPISDSMDKNFLNSATFAVHKFRNIAQKFPQSPTITRQHIDYLTASKQAYVSNGLVDPEFWNEAFGKTPTQEQTTFAISVNTGFWDARADLLLDTAKVQSINDVPGRFLTVIDENDIQPRLSGEKRDFGSFYATLPSEDTHEERRQLNANAFNEEQIQSAISNPSKFITDAIGLTSQELDDPDQKRIFESLMATAKREITSVVTNLRVNGANDGQIISQIQEYTQTFVDGFPDMFKDRIIPVLEKEAAEDRQTAFEKVDTFSDIEALIIERAKEEEYEILKGSQTAKTLVNQILQSDVFKGFDSTSGGAVPNVSGAIEDFFSFGQAEFLATQEAAEEAQLEQFQKTDTFAEIESLVRDRAAFNELDISSGAVAIIARRITNSMNQAASTGAPLPNAGTMINEFFESGEANQFTIADKADESRRLGEAQDITEGSIDKAFRFAEATGLLTASSSPEFRQHIEEAFIGPAANALDIARVGDPEHYGSFSASNAFLQDFIDELQADPSADLTEQRFLSRIKQQTDVPYGQVPTITGGMVREPTPVTVDPTALRPAILEQLGADASPGFLNFLFRNEPELLAEFQQTQQPSIDQDLFDERLRMFSKPLKSALQARPGIDPLMEPESRVRGPLNLTPDQARQVALAGSSVTPPTAGAFLGSRIPGLRQEFRESPSGIAETRSEEQRVTREAETSRLRAEQEVEQSQSRALRRGGRTVFSRIRG